MRTTGSSRIALDAHRRRADVSERYGDQIHDASEFRKQPLPQPSQCTPLLLYLARGSDRCLSEVFTISDATPTKKEDSPRYSHAVLGKKGDPCRCRH